MFPPLEFNLLANVSKGTQAAMSLAGRAHRKPEHFSPE